MIGRSCELLSDFVYSFFEHNGDTVTKIDSSVVNCFQILYIRSLNTINVCFLGRRHRCELLSDFVYSFFEHNRYNELKTRLIVVNCFQILYIRSLNTIGLAQGQPELWLWIAFRFCIFVLWTQYAVRQVLEGVVVNCFQILYIRSLNTIGEKESSKLEKLWIAFRFCIFVLWTQCSRLPLSITSCCELLSDFVYSFFEHNCWSLACSRGRVVNCFQILYIRSLNTMLAISPALLFKLWIAFRFCIFVLWTQ